MGLRDEHPEFWAELVSSAREIVGDWTEDQIAAVLGKVLAPSPDLIPDHIGRVLAWCAAAQASDDEEAQATVELWQHPQLPIEIMVGEDGRVSHRLDPDVSVRIE